MVVPSYVEGYAIPPQIVFTNFTPKTLSLNNKRKTSHQRWLGSYFEWKLLDNFGTN